MTHYIKILLTLVLFTIIQGCSKNHCFDCEIDKAVFIGHFLFHNSTDTEIKCNITEEEATEYENSRYSVLTINDTLYRTIVYCTKQ